MLGTNQPLPGLPSPVELSSAWSVSLSVPLGGPGAGGWDGLSAPVLPALVVLPWAVPGHHFPLLLQSLGVKCRHFESMRRSRLSMARSCPSTMSSDNVRIYWPWAGDGTRQVSHGACTLHLHTPVPARLPTL